LAAAPSAPAPVPQAPTRPDYIPEAHWDPAANKVRDDAALSAHFNQIIARDAAAQSKMLTLPLNADAYKVELPATFQPAEGLKFEIRQGDPLWAQARSWAHKNGLSQEAFQEGIALIAADRVGEKAMAKKAFDTEVAKLGPLGPQRVDAVTTYLSSFGEDGKHIAGLMQQFPVAATIKAFESMIARATNQGGAQFRQNGREPPAQPGKVTEAEYAAMTPSQKWDYSRSFDQKQFQTVPGGRAS
jgi:hypothetical protein